MNQATYEISVIYPLIQLYAIETCFVIIRRHIWRQRLLNCILLLHFKEVNIIPDLLFIFYYL